MSEAVIGFFSTLAAYVVGTAVSAVILGFMVDRFVIKKIMANNDVKDLIHLFREAKEKLAENLEEKRNHP